MRMCTCTYMRAFVPYSSSMCASARYLLHSNRHVCPNIFCFQYRFDKRSEIIFDNYCYTCALFSPLLLLFFFSSFIFSFRFVLRLSLLARCCYTQNLHKNHLSFSMVWKSRGDEGIMPTLGKSMMMA